MATKTVKKTATTEKTAIVEETEVAEKTAATGNVDVGKAVNIQQSVQREQLAQWDQYAQRGQHVSQRNQRTLCPDQRASHQDQRASHPDQCGSHLDQCTSQPNQRASHPDQCGSHLDQRLAAARDKIIGVDRQRLGIGTLSEKTLHAILKNTYEPDEDKQEIPIGRFYADIYNGTEIIEIQTAQFNRMREKLEAFLPEYPVTIVYPIAKERWLYWIDEETGQVSEKRKSPKKGNPYTGFPELYKIKMFLKNPNLKIRFLLLDMEEYKLLNGWGPQKKNNASKYDRIPLAIREEYIMERKEDYMQFVPFDIEETFTSKTFSQAAHIPRHLAQTVLNILDYMEVVERVGKEGNSYQYRVCY